MGWLEDQRDRDKLLARDYNDPERYGVKIPPGRIVIPNFYGWTVRLISGDWVRDNVYVDFTEGGNPARYAFIPAREIWIEEIFDGRDREATLLHEYVEMQLMMKLHLSYEHAHDTACVLERYYRKNVHHDLSAPSMARYLEAAHELAEPLRWRADD